MSIAALRPPSAGPRPEAAVLWIRVERQLPGLTPAECDVVELVMRGEGNRAIARHRGTSVHTVGNQLAAVFDKLGVGSRYELVARVAQLQVSVGSLTDRHCA